jgi:hypothetical protein
MKLTAHPRCPTPTGKIFLSGAASCALNGRMWLPTEPFPPPPAYPIQQLVATPYPYFTPDLSQQPPVPVRCFSLADALGLLGPSRRAPRPLARMAWRFSTRRDFSGPPRQTWTWVV